MSTADRHARDEWKASWPLVLASLVGISFPSIASYSLTFFIDPLGREFGWSRTEISVGLTIFALVVVPLSPVAGAIMDRWGPRRMALAGMVLTAASFASFGLTTGSFVLWIAQWVAYSLFALGLKTTVWTAAVSGAFDRGRGMAIAVTLCGTALAQTLVPLLAHWLIEDYGWRMAYIGLGLGWGGFALVLTVFLFFERRDPALKSTGGGDRTTQPLSGLAFGEAMRNPDIVRIGLAMLITSMLGTTLVVHKVPLLAEMGVTRGVAAQIAATAGVAGITGKLVTGWLYDRFPTRWIGALVFSLPTLGYACLLEPIRSPALIVLSMIVLGFGAGATMQANVYLTSRYAGLRNFGKIYGVMGSVVAFAIGVGPVIGGLIYDHFGTYRPFILGGLPFGLMCGVLMLGLRPYPVWSRKGADAQNIAVAR